MDALREIARVLKPAGVFGMIWNIDDCTYILNSLLRSRSTLQANLQQPPDNAPKSWTVHPGWEKPVKDLIWTFDDSSPRFRHEKWRDVFDEQNASNPLMLHFADPLFGLPIGEDAVGFTQWLTEEEVWGRLRTLSQLAVLEGEELDKVRKVFEEGLKEEGTERDERGRVALHGQTVFFWTSRIPSVPMRSGG